jgi:iron complex transport system ATP-binding protein
MTALTADGLCVSLNGHRILTDIALDCAPGRIHGLIGPNGAGKSTLLKALAGLIAPERGELRLGGTPLADIEPAERARRIAYLPQGGDVAWPLSVMQLVTLGRLPHRTLFRAQCARDAAAIARALARMDAGAMAALRADRLSAGERARVLLARALAVEAPILLADEPVAALDPLHQLEVMHTLREEAAGGAMVVVVLHDLTLAARFCDRLLLLNHGRIAAAGAPSAVLSADALSSVFGISAYAGSHEGEAFVLPWRAHTRK